MTTNYKFRAWDKINDKLKAVRGIDWEQGLVFFAYFRDPHGFAVNYVASDIQGLHHVHLMLYSEFTDNNGVQICEGDILRGNGGTEDDFYGEVIFEDGGFALKVPWAINVSYPPLKYYIDVDFIFIKIVGNIYENPDLLNQEIANDPG